MIKQLLSKAIINMKRWAEEPGTVLIVADEKSIKTANGQFAFCMAINMLSRLYPILTHIGVSIPASAVFSVNVPLFNGNKILDAVLDFINKLKLDCKVERIDLIRRGWDAIFSIGPSNLSMENTISIASDGWIAYVSTDGHATVFTKNTNPIGAYAAACIGGMEVFKKVFLKKSNILFPEKASSDIRWRLKLIEGQLSFSAFDYRVNGDPAYNPSLPLTINVQDLTMTGVGAGGGAVAYTLASLHDLKGRMTLIDPDEVKPSNMNRYVYALHIDATNNRPKVEVVKELFSRFKKLDVQAHQISYQKWVASRKIDNIDVLISTVDTKETRRNMQWDMPRVILDAAAVLTDFYVRRVDVGKSPCLICTHSPKFEPSLEEILSEATGLSANEIAKLRSTNACLTQEHIKRMTKSSKKYGFTLPSVGERFSDWLMMHCGELVLSATQERFPLPFATVLPGILIAGEVIKERYFPQGVLQNYYSYDMINLPASGMIKMKPVSDCIFCSSPTTKERFAKKYG
jgi:molybdopterin/thiamine biosynthesis adenylyltransferase